MSEDMESLLRGHRRYFAEGRTRDVRFRAEALRRLRKALRDHTDALCEALRLDLHKSASESYLTEIGIVLQEIARHLRRLKRWTAGRRVPSPLTILPSGSRIVPEPLGVVLIVAPWNYPVQLLLNPLVGALSAGNCAVLKSSPLVPHTEALQKRLIGEVFPPGYVSFLEGGPEVVEEVLKQRFVSIFFTGGSAFGQTVMRAAAEHLTPLTLELGGKSPCIVGRDADIPLAARRIVWGKLLNAGQTCVAPDYLFVHADRKRQLCVEMERAVRRFFGDDPRLSDDYPRIVSVQAAERLQRMMHGSGKILFGGTCDPQQRYVAPTLIDEPDDDSPVMRQEIFGPLLPVKGFHDIETVIRYVNERDKPLALYYFGGRREADRVLRSTSSGGACVNDTVVQLANGRLPFGGVGRSGIGKYHGRFSFELFSNLRAVVRSPRWIDIPLRYAPYRSIRLFKKFLK